MTHIITMLAAIPVCFGLLCRMDGLNIKSYKLAFVGLHLFLFLSCFAAFVHGMESAVTPQDGFILIGSACWLALSWGTWRAGPPAHSRRHT